MSGVSSPMHCQQLHPSPSGHMPHAAACCPTLGSNLWRYTFVGNKLRQNGNDSKNQHAARRCGWQQHCASKMLLINKVSILTQRTEFLHHHACLGCQVFGTGFGGGHFKYVKLRCELEMTSEDCVQHNPIIRDARCHHCMAFSHVSSITHYKCSALLRSTLTALSALCHCLSWVEVGCMYLPDVMITISEEALPSG
jgi:hypothetical protein